MEKRIYRYGSDLCMLTNRFLIQFRIIDMNEAQSTIQLADEYSALVVGDKEFTVERVEWSDPSKLYEGEAQIYLGGTYDGFWMSIGYENGTKNGKGVVYRPNHLIL